jgi:hypothetical protein
MRTVIHTGIVNVVATSTSLSKLLALSSPVFSLGELNVTFYVPGGWEFAPFKPGDFVAIAGRKTFMPGVQYVALAYRRLWVGGPGHGIGRVLPLSCVGAGLLGAYFAYLCALSDLNGRNIFIPMLALGALGLFRLVAIQAAVRQLNQFEMPLTSVGGDRDAR